MPDMTSPTDIAEDSRALRFNADAHASEFSAAEVLAAQREAAALEFMSDVDSAFPIGLAELEAIEKYLADVLDLVLASDKDAAPALHCHKPVR